MNSSQIQNLTLASPKLSKTYNLAIQFSNYDELPKKNILNVVSTYRLPRIADVDDQENTNRKKSPVKNIFQSQKPQAMKVNQLMNEKSFNIVGKKQVKAYQSKIIIKKQILQRRNQSALSLSRYSSSAKSQNQTGIYMNKQDVLGMVKIKNQQQSKLKNDLNSTIHREQHGLTLRKARSKLDHYTKIWDCKINIKGKYPSILQKISEYRRKVQTRQENGLNQKKSHMKQNIWMQSLRSPKNVLNYYKNSFVTKVQKNGLAIRGKQKLKQEIEWIQKKDKLGYNFAFCESYVKVPKQKQSKQQKRIGSGQSMIKCKPHQMAR